MSKRAAGVPRQLDPQTESLDFVADDLGSDAATGRCGMTAEAELHRRHLALTVSQRDSLVASPDEPGAWVAPSKWSKSRVAHEPPTASCVIPPIGVNAATRIHTKWSAN